MKDSEINDLFASSEPYDDADIFEARVVRGLQVKLWARQWLVVLAGFVGGLYALAQFVHVPNWTVGGKAVYAQSVKSAATDTDQTLRAGVQFFDDTYANLMSLADRTTHYLMFMQTPAFFWVSFSLCLAFLALYYAYSQEETL